MVIITESYAVYRSKVGAPQHDTNGGYLDAKATKCRNYSLNNALQFFKMQLFWAALPGEICHLITQKDQTNITLNSMYKSATSVQREIGVQPVKMVMAVKEESNSNKDNEEEVAAFQN
jgi:hypothetical protein